MRYNNPTFVTKVVRKDAGGCFHPVPVRALGLVRLRSEKLVISWA